MLLSYFRRAIASSHVRPASPVNPPFLLILSIHGCSPAFATISKHIHVTVGGR
jgi:hypothetical protein